MRQFAAQGSGEAGFGDLGADVGVKIAIRAFGEAEGPVDVEGEGVHGGGVTGNGWEAKLS